MDDATRIRERKRINSKLKRYDEFQSVFVYIFCGVVIGIMLTTIWHGAGIFGSCELHKTLIQKDIMQYDPVTGRVVFAPSPIENAP